MNIKIIIGNGKKMEEITTFSTKLGKKCGNFQRNKSSQHFKYCAGLTSRFDIWKMIRLSIWKSTFNLKRKICFRNLSLTKSSLLRWNPKNHWNYWKCEKCIKTGRWSESGNKWFEFLKCCPYNFIIFLAKEIKTLC